MCSKACQVLQTKYLIPNLDKTHKLKSHLQLESVIFAQCCYSHFTKAYLLT